MSRSEELPLLENDDKDVFPLEESQAVAADLISDDQQSASASASEDNDDAKLFMYDVFISYSKSDRPWVKDVLLQILEKEGKKVCIDYRDFQIGETVTDNIVHAIENSHVTILVLTPSFVESDWCMYESKQALVSSLNKSRARVLPLILMECHVPDILKHLTYLDHTSEDVQPYFKEQLIDSLDNAKKWIPPTASHPGCDIVPISEVQQVVARSLDQDEKYKTAIRKLEGALYSFRSMKCLFKCCITLPCWIALLIYFVFMILFVVGIATQRRILNPLKPASVNYTSSKMFVGFEMKNYYCELISIKEKYSETPLLVDTFAFTDPSNKVLYTLKENTTQITTSLYHKKFLVKSSNYRIHGDMSTTVKFCFRSQSSVKLRLYKPTSTFDIDKFNSPLPYVNRDKYNFGVKHQDFKSMANKTFCGSSSMKGPSVTEDEESAFVFHNLGTSTMFLNFTFTVSIPSFRSSLAVRTCLNLSYCEFPSPSNIRYIIVTRNISIPNYLEGITVKCIYKIPVVLYSMIAVLIFILCSLLICFIDKCFNVRCGPRLKRWYFKRETVRERLGENLAQMLDDNPDIDELYKNIQKERERKVFAI